MTYTFTEPFNYQRADPDDFPAMNTNSPNLVRIEEFLAVRYGGRSAGIYVRRAIRGGNAPSTHAYGAALDWRWGNVGAGRRELTREQVVAVIDWLTANALDLGIQQIHDYLVSRIWKIGRGWEDQQPSKASGMGQRWAKWLHIETHPTAWNDGSPVVSRLNPDGVASQPVVNVQDFNPFPTTTTHTPPGVTAMSATVSVTVPSLAILRKGSNARTEVIKLQCLLRWVFNQLEVVPDGNFGSVTEQAVRNVQAWCKLTVDGVVGRQTWTAILDA
jgi:peptidoglycan hydrolase-like protein with peptidoglycan-binding domain